MSPTASPAVFTISDTIHDGPAAIRTDCLSDHVILYYKRYATNCICLRQTMCKRCAQNLPMLTFPAYFLVFITDCHYTLIIYYALLTCSPMTS